LQINTAKTNADGGKVRSIRKCTEPEVRSIYTIGTNVMPSTNTGMDVLHARRVADGKDVVIKRRMRHNSFKSAQEEREWRGTTEYQLNMPMVETICQFHEAIETPQAYYVVMEKVMGKDLFELMASERVPQEDAREVVRQILVALAHMHAKGRIHKDLKIENVMVAYEGGMSPSRMRNRMGSVLGVNDPSSPKVNPMVANDPASPVRTKIIDFDTVQDWEPASPKCKDVLGTDGYIAPEAYGGTYSPASDIYAVGVIMYKLLTRKYPLRPEIFDDQPGENWVGSTAMQRIQRRLKTEPIDFSRAPFGSSPAARQLCAAMLAYEPQDRPHAEQALNMDWFKMDLSRA